MQFFFSICGPFVEGFFLKAFSCCFLNAGPRPWLNCSPFFSSLILNLLLNLNLNLLMILNLLLILNQITPAKKRVLAAAIIAGGSLLEPVHLLNMRQHIATSQRCHGWKRSPFE